MKFLVSLFILFSISTIVSSFNFQIVLLLIVSISADPFFPVGPTVLPLPYFNPAYQLSNSSFLPFYPLSTQFRHHLPFPYYNPFFPLHSFVPHAAVVQPQVPGQIIGANVQPIPAVSDALGNDSSEDDDGSYKHDPTGDNALPYVHDPAGDEALAYIHDTTGDVIKR